MKHLLLATLLLLTAATTAFAQEWTADNIQMVHLQDSNRYACNPDGVLSQAATDSIDYYLNMLENKTGVQTVLMAVKRIKDGDTYQFGMGVAKKYGIGSKSQRTGLIIVLSTEDRAYDILTGNGLEGTLPDATCKQIELDQMVPALKEGDWDRAMLNTVKAICAIVLDDPTLTPETKGKGSADDDEGNPVAGLIILGTIGGGIYAARRASRKKCPECGKRKMKVTDSKTTKETKDYKYITYTYTCANCGHTMTSEGKIPNRRNNSGGSGGAAITAGSILSSMASGSSRSSGGSRGGSFGGGSFGGGGARGRF